MSNHNRESGNDVVLLTCDSSKPGYINPTSEMISFDAPITRSGIFLYEDPRYPNGIRRDYRPPEEVFDEESLETITNGNLPLIRLHPDVGIVTSTSFKGVDFIGTVGTNINYAGRVTQDGTAIETDGIINGRVTIFDDEAIQEYQSGKIKSGSLGYTTYRIYEPGTINGVAYDAVQTKIRYNHMSSVPIGRLGIQDYDQRVQRLLESHIQHDGVGFDDLGKLVTVRSSPSKKTYIITPMATNSKAPTQGAQEFSADHYEGVITGLRAQIDTLTKQVTDLETKLVEAETPVEADPAETKQIIGDALQLVEIAKSAQIAQEGENLVETAVDAPETLIARVMSAVAPQHVDSSPDKALGILQVMHDSGAIVALLQKEQPAPRPANGKPVSETAVDSARKTEQQENHTPKPNKYASRRQAWLSSSK